MAAITRCARCKRPLFRAKYVKLGIGYFCLRKVLRDISRYTNAENYESYQAHESKSFELLNDILTAASAQIPESVLDGLHAMIDAGQFDEAIESILDLSGASHLFTIPSTFIPKIEEWLDYFGTPGPDDDDYLWYSAKRAIQYSQRQEVDIVEKQFVELDIPKPDYDLIVKRAASSGTSPQELIVSWVKDKIKEYAYA
jgi:hypothetical protein